MTSTSSIECSPRKRRDLGWFCTMAPALALAGCHQSPVSSLNDNTASGPTPPAVTTAKQETVPTKVTIAAQEADPTQWLSILAVRKDKPGGWATGSFDDKRNRLTIDTKDITGFAVDTSRIPIRWDKLVIISIDGRTSELKERDTAMIHFILDEHAQWVVLEP